MRPEMTGIVVPGKLYGVMAAGRPAIFVGPRALRDGRHDPHGRLRDDRRARRRRRPGRRRSTRLAADPSLVRRMGERGRSAFLAGHEQKLCCARWSDLLAELTRDAARLRRARCARRSGRRPPFDAPSHAAARALSLRPTSAEPLFLVSQSLRPSPVEDRNRESPHSPHRPAAGGIGGRRRDGGPGADPPATERRRDPGQARPRPDPRAVGVPGHAPQGRRPRPGVRGALQQGDRARLVRRGRGPGPAVPQVRPRRARQGAGADRPDDGAGPGRPLRPGARAVPRADRRDSTPTSSRRSSPRPSPTRSPSRRSPRGNTASRGRRTRRCSIGSARAPTCARRSRPT